MDEIISVENNEVKIVTPTEKVVSLDALIRERDSLISAKVTAQLSFQKQIDVLNNRINLAKDQGAKTEAEVLSADITI